jgi:DNA-binding response OmpR family regulator
MDKTFSAPVLLVEDDQDVAIALARELEALGLTADHCTDGLSGLTAALGGAYQLIILDLGLPKLGGIEVCRRIREKLPNQAILILTGESDETSTVLGLEHGADDYVTKPFRPMELRARVRALLRRASTSASIQVAQADEVHISDEMFRYKEFLLDGKTQTASFSGNDLGLTPIEFALFLFFIRAPKRVFSREALLSGVWGSVSEGYEQNIRSHVSRLRKKIVEAGGSDSYLLSKRGFGYQFDPE